MNNDSKTGLFYRVFHPWMICSVGMLFYCYNYFLRVSPSVMQNDLMQGLHITASQFGTLAGFYYFIYTPMQVPAGMIYDRFGARVVQFIACLTATLGVGMFIAADSLSMAYAGRFMIGLGTAFAYIGVLKLASVWLPANRFATVAGLTTAFGMFSAIFSVKYLTAFVQAVGYKSALHAALIVGVVLSFGILLFLRSKPKIVLKNVKIHRSPANLREMFSALWSVLKSPQMWLIGVIGCLFYLPASVFLDVWGIPYLKAVYHITPEQAASAVSMAFVGWILAGPTIGALSDKIKRRRMPLIICALMASLLLSVIFYVPGLSLQVLYGLFFFVGVFCGAHPLCFAIGKEICPNEISGTAVAVTNTLIMCGGMIFHPLVGKMLDNHAVNVVVTNGIPLYSASDYNYALTLVPVGLALSIVLSFFLRETYCQSHAFQKKPAVDSVPGGRLVLEGEV